MQYSTTPHSFKINTTTIDDLPQCERTKNKNCHTRVVIMLSSILVDSAVFLHTQENVTLLRASELLLSVSRSSVKCCKQYALTGSTARLWRRHASVIIPLPQLFVIDKKLTLLNSDFASQSGNSV